LSSKASVRSRSSVPQPLRAGVPETGGPFFSRQSKDSVAALLERRMRQAISTLPELSLSAPCLAALIASSWIARPNVS
jgi:hypothetical protein